MTHPPTAELRSPHSRSAYRTSQRPVDVDPAADPSEADLSGGAKPAAEPAYSIRLATDAGAPCRLCAAETGSGPVGYRGEEAICDLCLLEDSPALGMVLALVAVTRAYGSVEPASTDEQRQGLDVLGAFARIYERVAAKSGPARRILPGFRVH